MAPWETVFEKGVFCGLAGFGKTWTVRSLLKGWHAWGRGPPHPSHPPLLEGSRRCWEKPQAMGTPDSFEAFGLSFLFFF